MLEVSHLTKRYGKLLACNDLSFSVPEGSITVLVGPNGAGKSTLIKSITGFLKYEGEIKIGGFAAKTLEAKRLLGYSPELPALYPNLTVREHLEFIARAYRLKDYQEYADQLLTRLELADKQKKYADALSKGMQQKLSVCCALLPRPKLLLLDEPMIGLDPHAIKEIKLMMQELRADGCAVLVSTHMLDSMDMLWDQTIIMKEGKLIANVDKHSLDAEGKSLEDVFFALTEGAEQ